MTDEYHPDGICYAGDTVNTCEFKQVYLYYSPALYHYDVMIIGAVALHFVIKKMLRLWH